jgi:hypothetical protein
MEWHVYGLEWIFLIMEYEFKIVVLADSDDDLDKGSLKSLQPLFDQGWEFVGQINQPMSLAGGSYNHIKSAVGVVLKKLKTKKTQEDLLP